jgi:hypothetical protein
MIMVEVRSESGRVIESREFSAYSAAIYFYELARDLYGRGVSIYFGTADAVLR